MVSLNSIQINSSIVPHPSKFSTNAANRATCKWLTGIVSQVLLMNCSLSVDWLYVKVILQLLRTPGTTHGIQGYALKAANEKINQSLYQVKSNGVARMNAKAVWSTAALKYMDATQYLCSQLMYSSTNWEIHHHTSILIYFATGVLNGEVVPG